MDRTLHTNDKCAIFESPPISQQTDIPGRYPERPDPRWSIDNVNYIGMLVDRMYDLRVFHRGVPSTERFIAMELF